jgi:hypothetical protein
MRFHFLSGPMNQEKVMRKRKGISEVKKWAKR